MRVCPICEGYTASSVVRCSTCEALLVDASEVAWPRRDELAAAAQPWLGMLVGGKYRVTGSLGRGGMGTVYRAVHELSLSPVALKVLHPRFARRKDFKESLVAEARKASLLRSEHVSRVRDVGETPDGAVFIAMELVEGETLGDWLQAEGRLPPWVVVELMLQLCAALEDAEKAGVVHRDLSPRNVMIESRPGGFRAKVLDFGIAHVTEREPGAGIPESGVGWVNPPYTAPEILRGLTGDVRSDLYSLGVIAFLALSGRLPHGGAALADRVRKTLEEPPAPLVAPGAPRRLLRLVRKLMAKDAAARPSSVAEVRDALLRVRRPHGLAFQIAAVLAFIAGSSVFLSRLSTEPDPMLQSSSRSALFLSTQRQAAQQPQYVTREALERLELQAGDIRPGELSVLGYDGTQLVFEQPLRGDLRDGTLRLDVARDPDWRAVLDQAAALGRIVNLDFLHRPTKRLIAFATVFVDTRAPRLAEVRTSEVLNLASRFAAVLDEDGAVAGLELRLVSEDGRTVASVTPPLPPDGHLDLSLGAELRANAPSGADLDAMGPARLLWTLRDRAGRVEEGRNDFRAADLSIPAIRGVRSRDNRDALQIEAGRCDIRLELDRPERQPAAITARIADPPAALPCQLLPGQPAGNVVVGRLDAPPDAGSRPLEIAFRLVDECGNESDELLVPLEFRSLALQPEFRVLSGRARLVAEGDAQVLYLPLATLVELEYRCNEAYVPELRPHPDLAATLDEAAGGSCRLRIGPCPRPLGVVLTLEHRSVGDPAAPPIQTRQSLRVACLPDAPELLPVARFTDGQAFTPQLCDPGDGILELGPDGKSVRLSSRLNLRLPAELLARGRLWVDHGDGWSPRGPERGLSGPQDLSGLTAELAHGRNRIALELQDVLGRSLRAVGDDAARSTVQVDGHALVVIGDFRHDATQPQLADVLVEHGQKAVIQVVEDQRFADGAEVILRGPRGETWRGEVVAVAGGCHCSFEIEFPEVQGLCSWRAVPRGEFPAQSPVVVGCELRTPAGRWSVAVRFVPTRSLLRELALARISRAGPELLTRLRMVPFLGDPRQAIELGPPAAANAKGSVHPSPPVRVDDLGDFFLSSTEVSREVYALFVAEAVTAALEGRLPIPRIGHHEDPLGEGRFTVAGLTPATRVFGPGVDLAALVQAGPQRSITGVNYYQAQAFTRWLGWRLAGEPELFRLPFAAELEWAALSGVAPGPPAPLNGLRPPAAVVRTPFLRFYEDTRRRAAGPAGVDPRAWPATMAELAEIGDFAEGLEGDRVYGLDFGVREWVEDVPTVGVEPMYRLIVQNHNSHRSYARRRRAGEPLSPPLLAALANGEIRGLGFGEPEVGGRDPRDYVIDCYTGGPAGFGPGLLGVKRIGYVRRDGQALTPGRVAPLIEVTGFRVAGSEAFVQRAREVR